MVNVAAVIFIQNHSPHSQEILQPYQLWYIYSTCLHKYASAS